VTSRIRQRGAKTSRPERSRQSRGEAGGDANSSVTACLVWLVDLSSGIPTPIPALGSPALLHTTIPTEPTPGSLSSSLVA
jgi:hypothetical protein